MNIIKPGIYKHYKGSKYKVIGEAQNSEDKQEQVVYQSLEDEKIWCRPKKMFSEEIETKEGKKPRFELIKEDDDSFEKKYLRALADNQNLLKQTAREKEEFVKYAISDFLYDLLPVYDHLKLSINGLSEEEAKNPWAIGVNHVLKQFKKVLANRGIEEIKTKDEKFDHNTMEAIEGEGEMIDKEIMPGYKLNGRIIRPAKVTVKNK
ncbi:MAG: nucleotide exchange factor GrpE [Patescibacteria group bacterium]|jgi:molecular chaperone GrpE|nr:nucleotide exchange factor GrpE [Patescibacteria group bacterium]MDD3778067.1 nucleotide exchange factor GrpE [Patescibacteria group bacterium]MDD3939566.1 nucleotide exchange factor GrpE [Patescibacteria group bacterium]MDD4443848.1 nucleotide exchange factor GrpE [Patescibacteria group bacterium]